MLYISQKLYRGNLIIVKSSLIITSVLSFLFFADNFWSILEAYDSKSVGIHNLIIPQIAISLYITAGALFFRRLFPYKNIVSLYGVVFLTMLFLYKSKIVKVTARLRSTVIAATVGIGIYYLLSISTSLITGNSLPLVNSNSYLGILFTAAICLLAAYNFLLDFDNIEKAIANKIDSRYEWALSFGLLVTFVWLYIEILRLLSKLRSR